MNGPENPLRRFAREIEPTEEDARRIERRALGLEPWSEQIARAAEPEPGAEDRVWRAVVGRMQPAARSRSALGGLSLWSVPVAAVGAVAIGLVVWLLRPPAGSGPAVDPAIVQAPRPFAEGTPSGNAPVLPAPADVARRTPAEASATPPVASPAPGLPDARPEPLALHRALRSSRGFARLEPVEGLLLEFRGEGALRGTSVRPAIAWDAGEIRVREDRAPDQAVAVETDEARVRVVGTAFTVVRGPLGTRVDVSVGRVAIDCRGAAQDPATGALAASPDAEVSAGGSWLCLPSTAEGLLARAWSLARGARPTTEVLATVDLALESRPPVGVVSSELQFVRAYALSEAGLSEEALQAVDAYLATGNGGRRDAVLAIGAAAAWERGGCESARPYLEALAEGAAHPRHLVQLASCVADADSARSRALLQRALDATDDVGDREDIARRLDRLDRGRAPATDPSTGSGPGP